MDAAVGSCLALAEWEREGGMDAAVGSYANAGRWKD